MSRGVKWSIGNKTVSWCGFTEYVERVLIIRNGDRKVKEINGLATDFKGKFYGGADRIYVTKELVHNLTRPIP